MELSPPVDAHVKQEVDTSGTLRWQKNSSTKVIIKEILKIENYLI